MVAPVILGFLLGFKQAQTVSLELRGVRLENAAPILAKTFGWASLDIGPSIKNDVLLVRAKNVDPEVLRQKLAIALNGTWENRPEGRRFTQSDEQKAAERKIYNTERFKFFTEITEKAKKKLLNLKSFDEATCKKILRDLETLSKTPVNRNNNNIWRRISKIDEQSPLSRFGYRAALRLNADAWMKLSEDNPKVVFCNRPNGMQLPFPFEISDLLDQTVQEQNQWSTYAAGEPLQGPRAGNSEFEGWYSLGSMNDHRQPFKTTDFYTVTMTLMLESQSVDFAGYDQAGHRTFETSVNFYDYPESEEAYSPRDELERIKKKMVKVQGDAAEYLDFYSPLTFNRGRNQNQKPISASLMEKILHPETTDPLSIAAPDVYFASIDTPNIVMVMNDNQRMARFAEFKDPRYGDSFGKTISDENGWFIFHQPNALMARKTMPDRKKLGPIMRFIAKNQRPLNLEEQADLAISLPYGADTSWTYQSYLSPLQTTQVENYNNRMALRIYGSLTGNQRERAMKQGIPISQLSEETKLEIFRSIYYSQRYETQVQMDWENMQNLSPEQQKNMNKMQELLYNGIYEEKTFVLPNGLQNNLIFKIDDTTTSNLYAGRPQGNDEENYYGDGRSITANELGQRAFRMQNSTKYPWEDQPYNKIDESNIRLATQRMLNMKLQISSAFLFTWNLNQTLITDPTVYTIKTLPQKVLDEIQKGYKEARDQDKNYGDQTGYPTRGGVRNPPPPPQ